MVTLSDNEPKDVYWHAQCMFLMKEYHRAAHILHVHDLEKTNLFCHYLAVECLLEAEEYPDAILLLNSVDIENMSGTVMMMDESVVGGNNCFGAEYGPEPSRTELLSSIWLLKARVLDAMDNRTMAMDAYVQALQLSVHCTEALDALVQHEMLLACEETELMESLPFTQQCSTANARIIRELYANKMKKYYLSEAPVRFIFRKISFLFVSSK